MAMSYKGTPYVWGGSTPRAGTAPASSVHLRQGRHQPSQHDRHPHQWKVREDLQPKPGDLVYQNGGSHAGIYIGGGKIIGAQNPSVGTVVRPATDSPRPLMGYYLRRLNGIRKRGPSISRMGPLSSFRARRRTRSHALPLVTRSRPEAATDAHACGPTKAASCKHTTSCDSPDTWQGATRCPAHGA
ncbi:NlpC/P60 family protein [Arthrobacter sp.]|uniref:NlpC/P60 family protein n=1 Tax=Arthrobacter sp. TaxID=1667 RepID=UPI003A8D10C4